MRGASRQSQAFDGRAAARARCAGAAVDAKFTLVAALLAVHLDRPVSHNGHTVLGRERHTQRVGTEADAGEGGPRVLQREVEMARGVCLEVAQFPLDQDVLQLGSRRQRLGDQPRQL